jgi:hypothetical protein
MVDGLQDFHCFTGHFGDAIGVYNHYISFFAHPASHLGAFFRLESNVQRLADGEGGNTSAV